MSDAYVIAHVLVHGFPPAGLPASGLLYQLEPGGWWELSAYGMYRLWQTQAAVEVEQNQLRAAMGKQLLSAYLCQNGLTG